MGLGLKESQPHSAFRPVFGGRAMLYLFEQAVKGGEAGVAGTQGYLRYGKVGGSQQFLGSF